MGAMCSGQNVFPTDQRPSTEPRRVKRQSHHPRKLQGKSGVAAHNAIAIVVGGDAGVAR